MKKKLLILPILAALLVACTGDELVVSENPGQETKEDGAIAFDAYLNRTVTRAGLVGGIELPQLQLEEGGFGVFAYYADGDLYSENAIPNFMYNQQVTYNTTDPAHWEYSPIKYWPNEFGTSAVSMGVDRVTFFAYAPYVGVDPATGQLTTTYYDNSTPEKSTETGITALTRNSKTGDPYVRYVGAFDPAKCVDLCYGVAAAAYSSSAAGVGATDGANNIAEGKPYIDVAKPQTGVSGQLAFNFKHALAKLNVQVDADVDVVGHSVVDALDNNTRIWVRSITFDGIAQRGYLNLNNGVWYDVIDNNRISHASVTIHDGRHDGAEALAGDSYETPTGFNPKLVQSGVYTTTPGTNVNGAPKYDIGADFSTTSGVTATPQPLFGETSHDLLVIPSNEPLRVTIVYDVETADATLPKFLSDGVTRGSTVENKITKVITLGSDPLKLEAGKAYNISLHLGMTSVKFDAAVSNWEDKGPVDDYLPANLPLYTAADPGAATITVPAATTAYQFGVKGFASNETVTSTGKADSPVTATSVEGDKANAGGLAVVNATIDENTTVKDKPTPAAITVDGSTKRLVVELIQKAAPLGLSVTSTAINGSKNIVLSATATGAWSTAWSTEVATPDNTANSSIIVYKNGTRLTYNSPTPGTDEFKWDAASHTIVLGENATTGDLFRITVKAGDAAAETVTFIVTAS